MSDFQNLDEQDIPNFRLRRQLALEQAAKDRQAAEDIDAAEKIRNQIREARQPLRKTTKRIDTGIDLQTLDIENIPAGRSDAPPPQILRDIGGKVGLFERGIGRVSTEFRGMSKDLRYTEVELDTGDRISFKRQNRISQAKKLDIGTDIQALDIGTFPVDRPAGMSTPQIINELGGLSLRAGAGFYDALTMPLRPTMISETVKVGAGVIFSQKIRQEIAGAIKRDPAGFAAELSGGFLGGKLLGKGIKKVKGAYTKAKLDRLYRTDLPDEAFFHPEESMIGEFPQAYKAPTTFKGFKPLKVAIKDRAGYEYVSIGPDDFLNAADDIGGRAVALPESPRVKWKPIGERLTIDIDQSVKGGSSVIDDLYKGATGEAAMYKPGYWKGARGAVKTEGLITGPMKPLITDKPISVGITGQKLTSFAQSTGERGFTQARANVWTATETRFIPRTTSTLLGRNLGPIPPAPTTGIFSATGILSAFRTKTRDLLPTIPAPPKITQELDIGSKALQGIGLGQGLDESLLPDLAQKTGQFQYAPPYTGPEWKQFTPQYSRPFQYAPPYTGPEWKQFTPTLPDIKGRQRQRPRQVQKQRQRQDPKPSPPRPLIPGLTAPPLPGKTRKRRTLLPPEKKKKGAPKGTDNLFAGQWRKYNLKDPMKLLEG